jgi:hypothetical protein
VTGQLENLESGEAGFTSSKGGHEAVHAILGAAMRSPNKVNSHGKQRCGCCSLLHRQVWLLLRRSMMYQCRQLDEFAMSPMGRS